MNTATIDTGMQALMASGLNLAELDDSDQVEVLTWIHASSPKRPDADSTAMLWLRSADGSEWWESGYWDDSEPPGEWRLAESGGLPDAEVLFWAEPKGPRTVEGRANPITGSAERECCGTLHGSRHRLTCTRNADESA